MSFHPDSNLPDCMMPDGGECCAGHAAVVEDWHKQRKEIAALRAQSPSVSAGGMREALEEISQLTTALRQGGPDPMDLQGLSEALEHATNLAHAALAQLPSVAVPEDGGREAVARAGRGEGR